MSISGRGQESDPAATMGEDDKERRIREMGEQIEGYKRKEEDRKIQLESSSARCRGYEDELFLLKERNDVLARTRIQLQMDWEKTADELRDLKAGGINVGGGHLSTSRLMIEADWMYRHERRRWNGKSRDLLCHKRTVTDDMQV